jgi:hypothetical protein
VPVNDIEDRNKGNKTATSNIKSHSAVEAKTSIQQKKRSAAQSQNSIKTAAGSETSFNIRFKNW